MLSSSTLTGCCSTSFLWAKCRCGAAPCLDPGVLRKKQEDGTELSKAVLVLWEFGELQVPWKATEEDWLTGETVKGESSPKLTDPFFRRFNHSVGLISCQNLKCWYHATVPEPPPTYLQLLHDWKKTGIPEWFYYARYRTGLSIIPVTCKPT